MAKAARSPLGTKSALAGLQTAAPPEVIVDFICENGLLFVALQSISDRPAYDVRVAFDKPFRGMGGEQEVSALRMFQHTPFLGPRRCIRTFLDTTAAYFRREEPTSIAATVTYKDFAQREYAHTIEHDLAIYADLSFVTRPAPEGTVASVDG